MATTANTTNTTTDVNSIPLDAPIKVKTSWLWRQQQTIKGSNYKKVEPTPVDLSGKWIMISGGNNGIGRRAALVFAAWGANIAIATRIPPPHETHPERAVEDCLQAAKAAGHEKSVVEWWEVDYSKLATIESLAAKWVATGRQIDVLCNNVGMAMNPGKDKFITTEDGFELMHQVILLSHVLLTLRLLPALAKAPAPRIVNTTSMAHFSGVFDMTSFNGEKARKPGQEAGLAMDIYGNNKLYMQTWTAELQRRLLQHPQYRHITVNGVHPGNVHTGIATVTVNQAGFLFRKIIFPIMLHLAPLLSITDYQGAMSIVFAATTPEAGADPKLQGVGAAGGKGGGRYYNRVWPIPSHPVAMDADCRLRVWKMIDKELKLRDKGLLDVLGVDYFEVAPAANKVAAPVSEPVNGALRAPVINGPDSAAASAGPGPASIAVKA